MVLCPQQTEGSKFLNRSGCNRRLKNDFVSDCSVLFHRLCFSEVATSSVFSSCVNAILLSASLLARRSLLLSERVRLSSVLRQNASQLEQSWNVCHCLNLPKGNYLHDLTLIPLLPTCASHHWDGEKSEFSRLMQPFLCLRQKEFGLTEVRR